MNGVHALSDLGADLLFTGEVGPHRYFWPDFLYRQLPDVLRAVTLNSADAGRATIGPSEFQPRARASHAAAKPVIKSSKVVGSGTVGCSKMSSVPRKVSPGSNGSSPS